MTSAWSLPEALEVAGKDYTIRTDYRAVLDVLAAMNDPELIEPGMSDEEIQWEKCWTMLNIIYVDIDKIPPEHYQEAAQKASDFIDMGIKDDGKRKLHIMDWEQDAPVLIPAVNRVIGKEVRAIEHLHWWTFLGAYMEIGECLFSQIINIRQKRASGKKLEKWEQEFYRANKDLIDLKAKYTEEEKAEQQRLLSVFD